MRHGFVPFVFALCLAGCSESGDEIFYEDLQSGTYVVASDDLPDGAVGVEIEIDLDAGTFSVSDDEGNGFGGDLTTLPEADWTTCCYLNGTGHTKFETVELDAINFVNSGLDIAVPRITADGPKLFDAENGSDPEDGGNEEVYSLTLQ